MAVRSGPADGVVVVQPPELNMAVPQNLGVASYYASLEWFRRKIASWEFSAEPLSVLSVDSGSPEYDVALARLMRVRRPRLTYTMVSASKSYPKALEKDTNSDLVGVLQHIDANGAEWLAQEAGQRQPVPSSSLEEGQDAAAGAGNGSAAQENGAECPRWDLVHMCLWRHHLQQRPTKDATVAGLAPTWEAEAAGHLRALAKPRTGAVVAVRFAEDGAFELRARLRALLASMDRQQPVSVRQLDEGPQAVADALSTHDQSAFVERIESQLDVTGVMGDTLSHLASRNLADLLGMTVEALAKRDSPLMERVIDSLCDASLAGDGSTDPVVVYVPLLAVCAAPPGGGGLLPEDEAALEGHEAVTVPRLLGGESGPNAGGAQAAADRAAAAVRGLILAQQPDAPDAATAAAERARLGEFFYQHMRGRWGHLTGDGAGVIVRLQQAWADEAYRHGGAADLRVPRPLATPAAWREVAGDWGPAQARAAGSLAVAHDPRFPHGHRGGFFNSGQEAWMEMRASWTAQPQGFQLPPYPPPVDADEVIDNLSRLQRTYTLPGPIRLPELIDLYIEIWEADD